MSSFWTAFLLVAIPVIFFAVLSTPGDINTRLWVVWFVGAAIIVGALIARLVFAVKREEEIAVGILAGLAVGGLALALTCFSNTILEI